MGGWWSSTFGVTATKTIRVAVVGHTETGKSHFVSRVSGDTETATLRPTYGVYAGNIAHGGYRMEFTEIGFLAIASVPSVESIDCVMWFIDSHDTVEDILGFRNNIVSIATPVVVVAQKQDKRQLPPRLEDLSSAAEKRVPLCIVHNGGRPFFKRQDIQAGEWVDSERGGSLPVPVKWEALRRVCQVDQLLDQRLYSDVVLTQLSYTDPHAPELLFDWIISKTT